MSVCKAHRDCTWYSFIYYFLLRPGYSYGVLSTFLGSPHVTMVTLVTFVSSVPQAVETLGEVEPTLSNMNSLCPPEGAHHSTVRFSSSVLDLFVVTSVSLPSSCYFRIITVASKVMTFTVVG